MRSHRISSTIAAATTLAVVLGGCGSDAQEPEVLPGESDSAGTSPDEAATTAEGTEGTSSADEGAGEDEPTEDVDASEGEDPVSDDGSAESGDGEDGDDSGLPTVPDEYADALVVAWGAGDQGTMTRLGTEEVVHILGDGGGPDWAQTGSEGAAGSTIVTYQNSQSGDVLTLRVDNAGASEGAEQAVVEARYETD